MFFFLIYSNVLYLFTVQKIPTDVKIFLTILFHSYSAFLHVGQQRKKIALEFIMISI